MTTKNKSAKVEDQKIEESGPELPELTDAERIEAEKEGKNEDEAECR